MKLPLYSLEGTKLIIHQGLNAKQEVDLAQIKASILEEVFTEAKAEDTLLTGRKKLIIPFLICAMN
jgi:hypothetical protein